MRYLWLIIAGIVATIAIQSSFGANAVLQKAPRISGFVAGPVRASQCEPVTLTFALTNNGDKTIYSQLPYSGSTYSYNQSMISKGVEPSPDRYMVAASLDGGDDGYPYRWGFRGYLAPGKTTTIMGKLSFIETGKYTVTTVLMKGNVVVDPDTVKTAVVEIGLCPPIVTERPVPVPQVNTYYNEENSYQSEDAYMANGHLLIQMRPYVIYLGGHLRIIENSIVIQQSNGNQVTIFPDSPVTFINGRPVQLPVPPYIINGNAYVSPRYMSPLLGADMYWDPYSRTMSFEGPYANAWKYGGRYFRP